MTVIYFSCEYSECVCYSSEFKTVTNGTVIIDGKIPFGTIVYNGLNYTVIQNFISQI